MLDSNLSDNFWVWQSALYSGPKTKYCLTWCPFMLICLPRVHFHGTFTKLASFHPQNLSLNIIISNRAFLNIFLIRSSFAIFLLQTNLMIPITCFLYFYLHIDLCPCLLSLLNYMHFDQWRSSIFITWGNSKAYNYCSSSI